ncbi:MAG: long-chain-fatty-acid--CoA ligase [Rhodomicrobiaceae bacterium]
MEKKSSINNTNSEFPWQKCYPEGVDWAGEFVGKPHFQLLDQSVSTYSSLTCTSFLGKDITYQEIGTRVNKLAAALQEMGIGKGDKVGLFLPNSPTYVCFYFAILKTGATVVNYNPLYTVEELSFQVTNSETSLMVTLDLGLLFDKCETLMVNNVLSRTIVASFPSLLPPVKSLLFKLFKGKDLAKISASSQVDKCIFEEDLLETNATLSPVEITPETDIAVLQYTGGTTGRPKGAMLTHKNISIQTEQIMRACLTLRRGEEVTMGILPFFHVFAMTVVLNLGIGIGARLLLMPKFEMKDALKLMLKERPTLMPGVPTLFNALCNLDKAPIEELKHLRLCISGGAPLPPDLIDEFAQICPATLVEGYGLSETSPVLTCNPPTGVMKPGSIGIPLPNTIISIRSLEDPSIEMPLGEKGEICATGPQVMPGYWNAKEETDNVFVGEFFRTGDIGYIDEDGYTFIVDRLKDLIISSGYNIYPRHVEDAIYKHEAVEEVTVIGVPDDYKGEAPKAFVKLKEGRSLSSDELMAFLKDKLTKIELPEDIEFREELPKTMVGKLSKKELRDD